MRFKLTKEMLGVYYIIDKTRKGGLTMNILRMLRTMLAVINGSAVVIVKRQNRAEVLCGRKCDKRFVVQSMAASLKTLVQPVL